MKVRFALLILSLGLAHVAAAQTKVSRTFPVNADAAVRIHALVGTVTVRGWSKDTVSIRGALGSGNRFHGGGGRAGIKMFVESENELQPASSTLEIMVPVRAKLWIKTATADVSVSNVSGSLDVYVISGTIDVSGNPADVNAEAIDGDVVIRGSPGWIRAKSASGSVTLRGVSRDASLSTVSGRIVVDGSSVPSAAFERAKFETVTGDISYRGSIERGADIQFDTHGGAVDITLPARGADLQLTTISGVIRNQGSGARPRAGRYGRGAELNTTLGDGGASVAVRTFKGSITVRRAK